MRGAGTEYPGNRTGNQYHRGHRPARLAQFAEIQAESALEQDDGNRQLDDRLLQRAEIAFGINDAEHRTGDNADNQHQRNGRTTGPPGNPLCADAEQADQRDLDH